MAVTKEVEVVLEAVALVGPEDDVSFTDEVLGMIVSAAWVDENGMLRVTLAQGPRETELSAVV